MTKITQSITPILVLSFFLISCTKPEIPKASEKIKIVDSATERHTQAIKVISQYTMEEWGSDLLTQIRSATGEAVSDEVKKRVREHLGAKDLLEKRVSLLTEIYSAPELAKLAELYANSESKAVLRKNSLYEIRLRELSSPWVMEVLSNAR